MTTNSITETQRTEFFEALRNTMSRISGRGPSQKTFQSVLSGFDKFGQTTVMPNYEKVGYTFFTRPKLNFTTTSLRQDPKLALMDIIDPVNLMFGIRCNLDTNFARSTPARSAAASSPWINTKSGFSVPLSNLCTSINGWPDMSLEYKSTEAGYFSEDQTTVRGSDGGRRTYDLSCTFRDIQGGFMMSYFFYWIHAMALQMEGVIVPYTEDIEANRLNYTCSIYRFVMDRHNRSITKWAKATGCFPVSLPIGANFDFNAGDAFVSGSNEFTINFKANHISYMDPRIFQSFNFLSSKYSGITQSNISGNRVKIPMEIQNNFLGIPFIDMYSGTNEMMFIGDKSELNDPYSSIMEGIVSSIDSSKTSYLSDRYVDSTLKDTL